MAFFGLLCLSVFVLFLVRCSLFRGLSSGVLLLLAGWQLWLSSCQFVKDVDRILLSWRSGHSSDHQG